MEHHETVLILALKKWTPPKANNSLHKMHILMTDHCTKTFQALTNSFFKESPATCPSAASIPAGPMWWTDVINTHSMSGKLPEPWTIRHPLEVQKIQRCHLLHSGPNVTTFPQCLFWTINQCWAIAQQFCKSNPTFPPQLDIIDATVGLIEKLLRGWSIVMP